MTKGGFVDSSRRVRSLQRQQDDLLTSHRTSPARGGLLAALNKSSFSASSMPPINAMERKSRSFVANEIPSVISISTNLDTKQKEYDKHMRLFEVNPTFSEPFRRLRSGTNDQSETNRTRIETTGRRREEGATASSSHLEGTGQR